MIYVNIDQILGLPEKIQNINSDIYNMHLLYKTGGLITGNLIINSGISLSGSLKASGEYFYLDINNNKSKILVGDDDGAYIEETGCFAKFYSISEVPSQQNLPINIFLESNTGDAKIVLGNNCQIIFEDNVSIISNNKFSINNSELKSINFETGFVKVTKPIRLNNLSVKDINKIIPEGSGSIVVLDEFLTGDFFCKDYSFSIYQREASKIKNITLIFHNTGISIIEEETYTFSGLNNFDFSIDIDDGFGYFKLKNNTEESSVIKGICMEHLK